MTQTTGARFDRAALMKAVEDARWERRLTWKEIAQQAGLVPDALWNMRRKNVRMSLDTAVSLLVWLGQTDIKPYLQENDH